MAAVVSFYSLGGDPDLSFSVYTEDEVPTPEPGSFWRVFVTVCASVKDAAERAIFSFQLMLSPAESLPWIDALKFAESCNRVSNKQALGAGGRRELAKAVAGCVRAELAATSKKARACTRCHHSLFHLRCPTCSSEDGLTSIPPLGNPVPLPMSSAPSIHPTTATIDALNSAARCAAALVARKQTPRTLQKAVEAAVAVMDNSRLGGGGLAAARSDEDDSSLSSTAGNADSSPEVSTAAGASRQQRPHQSPNKARRSRHTASLAPIHSPPSPSRCSSCSDLDDMDLNGCLTASEETISDGPTVPSPHPDTRFVPPVVPTLVLPSPTRARDPECDTPIQAPLTPAQAAHTQTQPNPHPTFPAFDRTSSSSSCRSTSSVTPDAPAPPGHHPHKKALEKIHEIEPASPNCIPALLQPSTLLYPHTSTDSSSSTSTHSLSGSLVATVTISPVDHSRSVTITPFNPPHFDNPSAALDALDLQLRGSRHDADVRIDVERYNPPARTPSPAPLSPSAPLSIPSHALEFDEAFTAVSSFFGQVFNTAISHEASSSASQSMASAQSSLAPSRAASLPTTTSVSPTPTLTPALSGRSSMEAPQPQPEADPPTPTLAPATSSHSRPPSKRTTLPAGKLGRADGGSRQHDQDAVRDGRRHGHGAYGGEAYLGPTTPRYMTPRYEIITTAVPTPDTHSSELSPAAALPDRLLSSAVPALDAIPSPSSAAADPSAQQPSRHQRPPIAPKAAPTSPSPATAIPSRGQSSHSRGQPSRRPTQPLPPSAILEMPQEPGVWGREGGPVRECLGSSPVNNVHVPKMLRHASQPVMAEIQEEPITAAEADRSPLRTVARQRTSPSYHSFGIQLGQGSFGTVQKGLWRGRMVAIKTICVQGTDVRGQEHAMREAAITYALDHPNIIKTYSWDIQVAPDAAAPGALTGPKTPRTPAAPKTPRTPRVAAGSTAPPDWVVSMVVELCDADLVQALRASCFHTPDRRALLPSILQIALDIARGMEHLHTRRIIHGDLKSTNVLLKHHRGAASGFVAKVADLGMSYKLPRGATEIVGVHSGTRGYIAPEVQHEGTISQSSDVYSFGVVLWELYHAKPASASRSFPSFQRGCPSPLEELTRSCLYPNPEERPTFGGIMLQLCPLIDAVSRPARQRDSRRSASQVTL